MLRRSQLPPRAPFRSKEIACPSNDLCNIHKKPLSLSSAPDDQPPWMDDLLGDVGASAPRLFHCRSASDSAAFLDDLAPDPSLLSSNDDENSVSDESSCGLESACVYGPYSPRRKIGVEFCEDSVLAALSDPATRIPLPFLGESCGSDEPSRVDWWGSGVGPTEESNDEPKAEKRYPRQRSRVRKLQHIAELERTVSALQALGSELQYKVSSWLQRRLTLSAENKKLKQHLSLLQHQKMLVDNEHQTLQREAERLKSGLARLSSTSEDYWQRLDWAKLNLS